MDEISRKKPLNFNPVFSAYVINNRKFLAKTTVGATLFFIFMIYLLFTGDWAAFIFCCILLIILVFLVKMGLRLAKNPNIVEIGEDGIWLEQNRIYIPRNRIKEIYTAQNETYVQHAMVTIKTNDIALTVTFTEKEYKETFKYNPFIKPMYSDENYKYIKLILPQTRGTIDEIGLNISKRELIQKLHTLIA